MKEKRSLPELDEFRRGIDNLDAILVHTLAERFRITDAVGQLKRERGLPPLDAAREEEQLARLKRLAAEADLDPPLIEIVFTTIVEEVRRRHRNL